MAESNAYTPLQPAFARDGTWFCGMCTLSILPTVKWGKTVPQPKCPDCTSLDSEPVECQLERANTKIAELQTKVDYATRCFEIECPCCGGLAASWAVSDGDSLECGCDGQISACSETSPYANILDCGCGGKGYPKDDKAKQ